MPSACCCTVSPITWSTYFACNCHRRCAPRKSKLCALSCSRSVHGFAKQLVVSAFTWPAAGLFKISSKPLRFATPRSLSDCSTIHSRRVRRSCLKKQFTESKSGTTDLHKRRQRGAILILRHQQPICATIPAADELTRLGLEYPPSHRQERRSAASSLSMG